MPYKVQELTESERQRIAETLSRWAAVHPRRNLPIIALADGTELTPAGMAEAVASPGSPHGEYLFRSFAVALTADDVEEPEDLDTILADYERDADQWAKESFSGA
ncbi:hypothetical protein [Streptomyces sp. TRM68367]|uniref:hypothetical protein n=1 Tax=Streptomyces sp. TRM68367 TaxID=2758415 RepID=UPI00165AE8D9|nr:hypothetical protein [Streptomyces sp. TRM68367]MBC9729676.1 hypothetical protein [Streptomyces sp. TRM68367]